MMEIDRLQEWLQGEKQGKISRLLDILSWIKMSEDITDPTPGETYLRELENFGYLDLDWQGDKWTVSRNAFNVLPAGDGQIMITGFLSKKLINLVLSHDDVFAWREESKLLCGIQFPGTLYLIGGKYEQPFEIFTKIKEIIPNITFSGCASLALATLLPNLNSCLIPGASPRFQAAKFRFDPTAPTSLDAPYRHWYLHTDNYIPGLYRWNDPMRFYGWFDGENWWKVRREPGIFLSLEQAERSVLRWQPSGASGKLYVERDVYLPPEHQKILTLASGSFPTVARTGLCFSEIPLSLALLIGNSLNQEVSI